LGHAHHFFAERKLQPGGYHFGSVWPLFTVASVGEYKYHRVQPAYANLRANALLALDGSLGHATEVLSVITTSRSPPVLRTNLVGGDGGESILRGMLGLEGDAVATR